jgi:hypothetical protein
MTEYKNVLEKKKEELKTARINDAGVVMFAGRLQGRIDGDIFSSTQPLYVHFNGFSVRKNVYDLLEHLGVRILEFTQQDTGSKYRISAEKFMYQADMQVRETVVHGEIIDDTQLITNKQHMECV